MRGFAALLLALLATSAHAEDAVPSEPSDDDAKLAAPGEPSDDDAKLHLDDEFDPVLLIERVDIIGNTNTQDEIIRRALPIAPGDVLHATDKRLRNARFKVLALGYFRDVTLAMKKGSQRGNVIIEI